MKKPADNANAPAPHLKTNKHIREDGAAFIAAYTRACAALRKLDGVVGVGFGRKEKGGRFTGNLAIEVFVRAKKALHAVAPEHRVPTTFEGYRTDVRVVPSIRPNLLCDDDTMYPTVQGGVQIEAMPKGSVGLGLGTLGCVVRKRRKGDGDDNVYLLTNHHVLFGKGTLPAVPPISVYQPYAPPVAAGLKTQFVGMVEERSFNEQVGHTASDGIERPCYIDCAVARIDLGSTCFGKSCPNNDRVKFDPAIMQLRTLDPDDNRVTGVRDVIIDHLIALPPGQDYPDPPIPPQGPPPDLSLATDENRVYKVGRTSAKTTGIVICVNAVAQTGPVSVLEGIIEIAFDPASTLNGQNCKGNAIFGEDGDSGSLILDKNNKAIGLLFAGRKTTPNEHSTHMTYACHIVPVLDKLNICIATKKSDGTYGSTDPGTDGATDGTGLATAATPEQLTAPASGGGAVFASYERSAPPRIRPPDIALGATVDHTELLAEFRTTRRGRQLVDAFDDAGREISYLVRHCRPVQIVWHRNHGPAFLAGVLNYVRGDAATMPRAIGGVSRAMLFERMRAVLAAHGSVVVKHALERHAEDVMLLADAETVQECVDALRRAELIGGAA